MTPEGKVKAEVKNQLKSIGAWFFMPVPGGFGVMGIPDFIGCYKGKFYAIECKSGSAKPTPLQARCLELIQRAGGYTAVINESNMGEVARWLTLREHQGL